MKEQLLKKIENIVGKGEIDHYASEASESVYMRKMVNKKKIRCVIFSVRYTLLRSRKYRSRTWRETVVTKIGIFFTKVYHLAIKSL